MKNLLNQDLARFYILENPSILDVLKAIDANKKGFVLILKQSGYVLGVITDGDVRRELISGKKLEDQATYRVDFEKLYINDDFATICEKFKSDQISFLPILDENGLLVNVLTKKVFHTLLLHDINWDLKNNFTLIDDNEIDFEVYNRPWGFYKSTLISEFVQSKLITIFPHSELSLQEHKKREEHWIIIKGKGKIVLGESLINIYPGKYIYIPKGCKHQIVNNSDENIILSEVQLGEYFGEDDIIRHQDKYGRK